MSTSRGYMTPAACLRRIREASFSSNARLPTVALPVPGESPVHPRFMAVGMALKPVTRRRDGYAYSRSNPWLENLSVRVFSVTVRTMFSGTPSGTVASISSVT